MAEACDKKILIADDVEMMLNLEELLLKKTGCAIIKAKTGTEALKLIQLEKPDIVLLDLIMPEMSGDVVCKFVKNNASLKGIKIIMVTSKGEEEAKQRCLAAGCDHYVTKPINHVELMGLVTGYLSR